MTETERAGDDPDGAGSDADLEGALRDPAFDELPRGASADPGTDPARSEDITHEPRAPHLSLEEEQLDQPPAAAEPLGSPD